MTNEEQRKAEEMVDELMGKAQQDLGNAQKIDYANEEVGKTVDNATLALSRAIAQCEKNLTETAPQFASILAEKQVMEKYLGNVDDSDKEIAESILNNGRAGFERASFLKIDTEHKTEVMKQVLALINSGKHINEDGKVEVDTIALLISQFILSL